MTESEQYNAALLAQKLAAEVGKESGPELLKLARVAMAANASKSGTATSEFKLSALLVAAGMLMVFGGVAKDKPDLQQQGVDLISVVGAGYAASRGLAKLGVGLGAGKATEPNKV